MANSLEGVLLVELILLLGFEGVMLAAGLWLALVLGFEAEVAGADVFTFVLDFGVVTATSAWGLLIGGLEGVMEEADVMLTLFASLLRTSPPSSLLGWVCPIINCLLKFLRESNLGYLGLRGGICRGW